VATFKLVAVVKKFSIFNAQQTMFKENTTALYLNIEH
jgi:hypothetical protein